jgi:prevent-host-death family protein
MATVNMLEAKTSLSKLVEAVESGAESEIIIARNGKPAAKLVALTAKPKKKRQLGLAVGKMSAAGLRGFSGVGCRSREDVFRR